MLHVLEFWAKRDIVYSDWWILPAADAVRASPSRFSPHASSISIRKKHFTADFRTRLGARVEHTWPCFQAHATGSFTKSMNLSALAADTRLLNGVKYPNIVHPGLLHHSAQTMRYWHKSERTRAELRHVYLNCYFLSNEGGWSWQNSVWYAIVVITLCYS